MNIKQYPTTKLKHDRKLFTRSIAVIRAAQTTNLRIEGEDLAVALADNLKAVALINRELQARRQQAQPTLKIKNF